MFVKAATDFGKSACLIYHSVCVRLPLPVLNRDFFESQFQLRSISYQPIVISYGRSVAGNCEKWSKRQEVARDAYGGQVISTVVDVGEGRFKF